MKNLITVLFTLSITIGYAQFDASKTTSLVSHLQWSEEMEPFKTLTNGLGYPWLSPDGLRLYFTRGSGFDQHIVFCERSQQEDEFMDPAIVEIDVKDPTSCWLSNNELTMYVTTHSELFVMKRKRREDRFGPAELVHLNGAPAFSFLSGPSLADDQKQLFVGLDVREDDDLKIAKFKKLDDSSFEFIQLLDLPVGVNVAQLSKNGLKLFFTEDDEDGNGQGVFYLERKKVGQSFNAKDIKLFSNELSLLNSINQYSFSADESCVITIQSNDPYWLDNRLCWAKADVIQSIAERSSIETVLVYPNPTMGEVTIDCGMEDSEVVIYDVQGKEIDRFVSIGMKQRYFFNHQGVYVIRVLTSDGYKVQRVVVN